MSTNRDDQPLDVLKVGQRVTLVDNKTGSVYFGRVVRQEHSGTKVAQYTKDGCRIAKRSIVITKETHTILEVSWN